MGPHEHPLDGSRGAQRGKGGAQASGAEGLQVTAAGLAERGGPGAVGGSGHTTLPPPGSGGSETCPSPLLLYCVLEIRRCQVLRCLYLVSGVIIWGLLSVNEGNFRA